MSSFISRFLAVTGLLQLLVMVGCQLNDGDTQKPQKPVLTYHIKKLDMLGTHRIPADKIRGLVTSGDGAWLYVVRKDLAPVRALNIDTGLWSNALGDLTGLLKAQDRSPAGNLSDRRVDSFSPSYDGLLLTLTNNGGLVVLRGSGVEHATHYAQGQDFPNGSSVPLWVSKDNDAFIYLFDTAIAAQGVRFRPVVEPPKLDTKNWNDSLRKSRNPKAHLDAVFNAFTQDHEGSLLLADKEGIKRLLGPDIGLDKKALDNNGKPIFAAKSFILQGAIKNDRISTMAMVDGKYLVVGLAAAASSPNTGGIAVADMTQSTITFKTFGIGLGLTVHSVATERTKQREKTAMAAVVTTDKGLIFLDNHGEPMELIAGKGKLVTASFINNNPAETNDYDRATNGFISTEKILDPGKGGYLGAAQDKNALWYIGLQGKAASDGGIFTLDVKNSQVEAPTPPPVLP